jgi:hypothetical protein
MFAKTLSGLNSMLIVNFSLIMSDVITEVLSYLFPGKAIKELFTGSKIC